MYAYCLNCNKAWLLDELVEKIKDNDVLYCLDCQSTELYIPALDVDDYIEEDYKIDWDDEIENEDGKKETDEPF